MSRYRYDLLPTISLTDMLWSFHRPWPHTIYIPLIWFFSAAFAVPTAFWSEVRDFTEDFYKNDISYRPSPSNVRSFTLRFHSVGKQSMIWKKIPYVKDAKLLKHYPENTHRWGSIIVTTAGLQFYKYATLHTNNNIFCLFGLIQSS